MKDQQLAKKKEKRTKRSKKRTTAKKERTTEAPMLLWIGAELILTL